MDEIKLRKDMERAARAGAVLANEQIMAVLDELEADYIAKWRRTRSSDNEIREASWHAVQGLADIRAKLQAMVDNGAVAARELEGVT